MSPNVEALLAQAATLDEIEARVREIFSAQKTEVEQSLVEKISREKEEAQRRIDAVNREFTEVRSHLEEHKTAMAELQTTEEHIRGEIRGHFERAVNYQKMMENAAALAGDELEKIGGLNEELEKVRTKAETEYVELKQRLSGYAGLVAQIPAPAPPTPADGGVDWIEEIGKLRKVRDLLATLRQDGLDDAASPQPEAGPGAPGEPASNTSAASAAEELAASLGLIDPADEDARAGLTFSGSEPGLSEAPGNGNGSDPAPADLADIALEQAALEPPAEPSADACAGLPDEPPAPEEAPAPADDPATLEALARYRNSESVCNGTVLSFFTTETAAYLDSDSFMEAVGKVLEAAQQLQDQLPRTSSVKDLFLLKQEILNQQEVLRKVFFRIVRFCDKESGRLPRSLDEIVSSRSMKDIIERLTMANWSDPSDFKPFLNELKAMRRAYEMRRSATPGYLDTVLGELEGREG